MSSKSEITLEITRVAISTDTTNHEGSKFTSESAAHPTGPEEKSNKSIDGGYAWLVLVTSFICYVILYLTAGSFPLFYVEWLDEFQQGSTLTAIIGSVAFGLMFCAGAIASAFVNILGSRLVTFLGGCLMAGLLFTSAFAPNILTLVFTFGVVTALGVACVMVGVLESVGQYFDKYLKTIITVLGLGLSIGQLLTPNFTSFLLHQYGWRGSLIMFSGICLQVLPCAATHCPNKKLKPVSEKEDVKKEKLVTLVLGVLKEPKFLIQLIVNICVSSSSYVAFSEMAHFVESIGLSMDQAALCLAVMALSGLVGRLLVAAVIAAINIDSRLAFAICSTICGCCLFIMPHMVSFITLITVCVIYGFFVAPCFTLTNVIVVTIFEYKYYNVGHGLSAGSCGVGSIIGPVLAGALYDITGEFYFSFYSGGISVFVSTLIFIVSYGSIYIYQHMKNYAKKLTPKVAQNLQITQL